MNFFDDKRFNLIDKKLGGPIVYAIHTSTEILYIGSSSQGLARTFINGHRQAKIIKREDTQVSIMYCQSASEALAIERELIILHKPIYNLESYKNSDIKKKEKAIRTFETQHLEALKMNDIYDIIKDAGPVNQFTLVRCLKLVS